MSDQEREIYTQIKDYIMSEFLPGENPDALKDDTPLISGGVLDSIKTIRLVTYLEETFGVEFEAHEITADCLDTLTLLTSIVESKK